MLVLYNINTSQPKKTEVEMYEEIFRGNLEECIRHYYRSFIEKSTDQVSAVSLLADFCDISPKTALGRLNSPDYSPVGESSFLLMSYLSAIGYKINEFERKDHTVRGFCETIAFRFISITQAIELLGYRSRSTFYQALYENQKMQDNKRGLMWSFWKQHKDALQKKRNQTLLSHLQRFQPHKLENVSIPAAFQLALPTKDENRTYGICGVFDGLSLFVSSVSEDQFPIDNLSRKQLCASIGILVDQLKDLSRRLTGKVDE